MCSAIDASTLSSVKRRALRVSICCLIAGLTLSGCAKEQEAGGNQENEQEDTAQPVGANEQVVYGCELIEKIRKDYPDQAAWDKKTPKVGSAVVDEITAAGALFGGIAGTDDPVDAGLEDTGSALYKAMNTMDFEGLDDVMEEASSRCDELQSTTSGSETVADTSPRGQVEYGCRLVKQTIKKYPDQDAWESSGSGLGSDRVWSEVTAASALFGGANGGQRTDVVDEQLQSLGGDLFNGVSRLDAKELDVALNAAWDRCQEL